MPFSRSLKVGGNNENMAKLMVSPATSAPSNVTVKLFAVEFGDTVGVRRSVIRCQVVWDPLTGTDEEA